MDSKLKPVSLDTGITIVLFSLIFIGVIAELVSLQEVLMVYRPIVVILLIVLYSITSNKKSVLFYTTTLFLFFTTLFLLSDDPLSFQMALISVKIHKGLLVIYCLKLNKTKDFIPILIAFVPFVFIFSYLLSIAYDIPAEGYYTLVIQNILVSILAGITLSNHFMNEKTTTTPWLSIFGLLSTALYFTVFIERFFLSNYPPTYFKPLSIVLFATSYFAFYKFVIHTENFPVTEKS